MTLIRKEIRKFESRDRAGRLMYPGKWIVTWVKTPHMPWMCAGMAPVVPDPAWGVYCVRFEVQTGKHLLGLNLSAFDPGCVPNRTLNDRIMLCGSDLCVPLK